MGDSIGGSHLSALELIKRLDNFYFYPLIVLHKKGILYNYLKRRKISFFFLPLKYFVGNKKGIFLNIKNLFLNFYKLKSFLNKNSIQFVHSNDSSIHLNWIIASKFSKCKFFWHLRIKFPDWRLYKILINFSDKIICISRYVYNTVPNKLKFKSVFPPTQMDVEPLIVAVGRGFTTIVILAFEVALQLLASVTSTKV